MNRIANIPLSQVTIIATALGIFFLIVAFYKSIFHKRRRIANGTKSEAAPQPSPKREEQPIRLADPFQQVPVDQLPLGGTAATPTPQPSPFYPSQLKPVDNSVSAFRQFNPKKEFEAAIASSKNETTYEWE
ncbi:MAG: hypothetical protein RBT78_08600 [Kiritimatiellia bacterium]|jgi:hypothetical protein|nr:hypothetical protein [Kiritimatiellia bacterium]